MHNHDILPPLLVEQILARLGFAEPPSADLDGLRALYHAWCRRIPFDNIRKLIYFTEGGKGPLPGDDPDHFFRDWMEEGTGGTCWSGNGALCSLLKNLGFNAQRALVTVLATDDATPNHGTVVVSFNDSRWCVDASMLFSEPLELNPTETTLINHPVYGVRCSHDDADNFMIDWHTFSRREGGMSCRFEEFGVSPEEFSHRHEMTRESSIFNDGLAFRLLRGEGAIGFIDGGRVEIAPDGTRTKSVLTPEERFRFLIDEAGISEEFAAKLPPEEVKN